jgi:tripartite-type tricarboxylate transporter receptor subunit TctC
MGALAVAGMGMPAYAANAKFPDGPIKMIVAFPPGGGTDIVARVIAPPLTLAWGQQLIIDNRGGAGGVIGTEAAARATPDGSTVFLATLGNLSINPHLYPMHVDPLRALIPITQVVAVNFVLVVNASLPVKNVKELIALAKTKPGQINYSSSGIGGAPHLAGELFNEMAGVKLMHIPYKGSGPSFTDLLGGQVSMTFDSLVQALPYIQDGRLRALAVLGPTRSPLLPDVPTVAEAGLPGYAFTNWFGLVAPTGTPPDRIEILHDAVVKVLKQKEVRDKLIQMGADPVGDASATFGKTIVDDSRKWAEIIKRQDIKAAAS